MVGTFLKTPSPAICEVLGRTDTDIVCIDAEHAPFDRRDISACILALKSVNIPSIVRIPAMRAEHILTALDLCADGIIAPHISSKQDAEFIVNKSKYGSGRGYAGGTRAAGNKSMPQHVQTSNDTTIVIAQIEDIEALDNLDAILSVDDIDCYFIGRSDLTISMGLTDTNHPKVIAAVEDICRRAQAAGRTTGMFTPRIEEIPHWRSLGSSLFLLGSDHGHLKNGVDKFNAEIRALLSQT